MIEVFDARRTRSFGCFASFSVAKGTLDLLARDGALGQVPSVRVMAYRNGELCRDYEAVFAAGCRKLLKRRNISSQSGPTA